VPDAATNADDSDFHPLVLRSIGRISSLGPLNDHSRGNQENPGRACSRVRKALGGFKADHRARTGLMKAAPEPWTAAGLQLLLYQEIPTHTAPQVGIGAGRKPHPVAILGLGGLARGWPGVPLRCWLLKEGNKEPEA